MTLTRMSENLQAVFYDRAETDPGFAIAYALMQLAHAGNGIAEAVGNLAECTHEQNERTEQIAEAIQACATHLKYLGVGDAATQMGAIEYLTVATQDIAHAIREAGEKIADAER